MRSTAPLRLGTAAGCLLLRTGDSWGAKSYKLHEIFGEEQVQRPVQSDAELLLKPWQLTEIDRAPQPPGKESENLNPRMLAIPARLPMAAKRPIVEKVKAFAGVLLRAARTLGASILPSN